MYGKTPAVGFGLTTSSLTTSSLATTGFAVAWYVELALVLLVGGLLLMRWGRRRATQ
ncbi:MAG: hypothetical protein QOG07_2550 [Pseudonocardiales bacterium]|jgi:hypothetical protein|nr:hypothetical protein [Pseudonocardiales bacterium]MDT4977244.1 hypothetical protein [Pseudonocardiales bacterium]MDT4980671.1 hypothetical protein [Pseudonocardiales bacterium]MDT4984233.1 hypothetical protein [Pseudonocardiales bacterium]